MGQTKIATCCYCGARAALVLQGTERHELACSNCGAPLHDLKGLKVREASAAPQKASPRHGVGDTSWVKPAKKKKKSRKKRKKSVSGWVLHEAFDLLDDLLD